MILVLTVGGAGGAARAGTIDVAKVAHTIAGMFNLFIPGKLLSHVSGAQGDFTNNIDR